MQMQGKRQLPVTQPQAWAALNDPAVLQMCVPGCESFAPDGADAYKVLTAIKIGPVSARFTGKVSLSDITPPSSYCLSFEGQGGGAGFGNGSSRVSLTPNDGGCELNYSVDAQVGGKIAQLGQRLIDGVAKTMADDFFKKFEAQLLLRHPLAVTPENAATNPMNPVTKGQFDVKNLVSNLLRDFSEPPWTYVAAGAVGAVLMLGLLLLAG